MATSNPAVYVATTTNATYLNSYASDGAFVAAKGSSASNGDIYYNSTYDAFRGYQGGAWDFIKRGPLPSLSSDANFVTAKGSSAANGDEYYNSTEHVVRRYQNSAWVTAFIVPGTPGTSYLGLVNATTTDSNDSIKITASDHTALAADAHIGYAVLPHHATAGKLAVFTVSSDITIKLTGATWGLGGSGDFTDVILRVYLINDAGTLKAGVTNTGGYRTITTALSSATQSDINLQTEMIVNSTLSGTSPCFEMGWFLADFDDTGGAHEDLWAVQTALGEINVGIPAPDQTNSVTYTPTGSWSANSTYTGRWRRFREFMIVDMRVTTTGAPTAANLTINLPSGYLIDTGKLLSTGNEEYIGDGLILDSGTATYTCSVRYSSTSAVALVLPGAAGTYVNIASSVDATNPMTWASGDAVVVRISVPILGWSGN